MCINAKTIYVYVYDYKTFIIIPHTIRNQKIVKYFKLFRVLTEMHKYI